LNLLCRPPASGTTDFNLGKLRLSDDGKTQNRNSESNYSTAATPILFEKPAEQPASAARRASRGGGCACLHGRATRRVWGMPRGVPSVGADGSVAGSPRMHAAQLRSQNLAAHATLWHYAGYASSGILPTGRKTCAYGKAGSQSAQTAEQHHSGCLKLSSAHMVAFNDGTNAQQAGVTFASFLYSNRSRLTADICLSGSRDFNRKSN
jgi:hypothetical protein